MSTTDTSTEFQEAFTQAATLVEMGQWSDAMERLLALKRDHPVHPGIWHLLGLVRQEMGDLRGAVEGMSQAATIAPDNAVFQLDLGILLKKKGARFPAMERLREALRLDPESAAAHFHLADLWMDQGEIEAAIGALTRAVAIQPDLVEGWINLGLCQKSRNQPEAARESFRQALRCQPDHPQAHVNLAMALLMTGAYQEGWQEYAWRFRLPRPSLAFAPSPLPVWQGEALQQKTILLLGEQGFGDMIQFIRFAARLAEQGARVLAAVPTPLVTLFRRAPGVAVVQDHLYFKEPIHYQIPLLSVPGILGTTLDTIPSADGYLTPDPQLADAWAARLTGDACKVGLIWAGKPLHANDPLRRRSCTLADLAPLAQLPGVRLFSLQKGAPELPSRPIPEGLPIVSLEEHLTDFAATAAIMSRMDRIITIDSATAHLAGALGRPVWTLLPMAPDWRWGMDQPTTPWYASMRLFRQCVTDRWDKPVAAILQALRERA
ncbi:MAG: tetratricopeptide repeat protein [Magnetococcales bacterium]|nr:tetratricopeptide repeat protein [Magnetococcales bacterium]